MPELKIGTAVDIIFESEINISNAHYMKALVYDYEGNNIIISQTSPALNRHFLNRRIIVTFLAKSDMRILRFGFTARLIDLIDNYQLSSHNNVEALILKQHEKPEPVDFRMYFRIKPPSQSTVNLFFREEKVNLFDISLGGAKFTYPKSHLFHQGDTITVKLLIDTEVIEIKARVRNLSLPDELSANKTLPLQYVGIEFEQGNRQLETVLGKAIIGIERQLLSKGKIN